jgi:hypothetical protein
MDDEIDRRLERLGDRELAVEPLLRLRPRLNPIRQALVVDDDQQVKVRLVAFCRVRLVDPAAACVRAVEDDLEDAALLFPVLGREDARFLELLEQDLHNALELALLGRRKMIQIGAHFA